MSAVRSFLVVAALLITSSAFAQSADSKPEFSVGLSFLREAGATGIGVGGNVVLPPFKETERMTLGILAGVALNHFEGANEFTLAGGVRAMFKIDNPNIQPFVQGRFGIVHCCGFTDKVAGPGGGVNFKVNDTYSLYALYEFRRIFDPVWAHEFQVGFRFSNW